METLFVYFLMNASLIFGAPTSSQTTDDGGAGTWMEENASTSTDGGAGTWMEEN